MALCVFRLLSHSQRSSSPLANKGLSTTSNTTLAWASLLRPPGKMQISLYNIICHSLFLPSTPSSSKIPKLLLSRSGEQTTNHLSSRLSTSSWSPAPRREHSQPAGPRLSACQPLTFASFPKASPTTWVLAGRKYQEHMCCYTSCPQGPYRPERRDVHRQQPKNVLQQGLQQHAKAWMSGNTDCGDGEAKNSDTKMA